MQGERNFNEPKRISCATNVAGQAGTHNWCRISLATWHTRSPVARATRGWIVVHDINLKHTNKLNSRAPVIEIIIFRPDSSVTKLVLSCSNSSSTIVILFLQARPHQILLAFRWFRTPLLELLHKSLGTATSCQFWPACTGSLFAIEFQNCYNCFQGTAPPPAFVPCSNSSKIHTFTITTVLLFYNHICTIEENINDHFKIFFIHCISCLE